mgnify:CR=1 FL=1
MNTDMTDEHGLNIKNIRANPSNPCISVVYLNRTRIGTDVTDQHGLNNIRANPSNPCISVVK